jgi:hypothetical protein
MFPKILSPDERTPLNYEEEELLVRLTQAAYDVALRHRFQGPFLDVQLDLWAALRDVLEEDRPRTFPADHHDADLPILAVHG